MDKDILVKAKGKGWTALERVFSVGGHEPQVLITIKDKASDGSVAYAVVTVKNARKLHGWLGKFLEEYG